MIDVGSTTATVALAVAPVPPSFEVTLSVVLFCTPMAFPTTLTLNVQELLTASVAPVSDTWTSPSLAVIVPPPQSPVRPAGVARLNPDGSISVKPTSLKLIVLIVGLVIVKLSVVVAFSSIVEAPNVLVMAGGATTFSVPEFGTPAPVSFAEMAPVVLV